MTLFLKKTTSFLMAIVMFFTCLFSVNIFAFADSMLELNLNIVQTVFVEQGGVQWFSFTPNYSANYTYYSLTPPTPPSNIDTYGVIYDTDKTTILAENDDADLDGGNYHFSATAYLEKGKTYYFTANHNVSTVKGQISVSLKSDKCEEIDYITASIGDFYLEENRNGNYVKDSSGVEYYKYDYERIVSSLYIYIYFADGTYATSNYSMNENTQYNDIPFYYSTNQEESHWAPDGNNLFTVNYMGASYTLNVPFNTASSEHTHSYAQVVKKPATTTEDGTYSTICTFCQNLLTEESIPKISTFIVNETSFTYDGNEKKPSVFVVDSNNNEISSAYYDVSYSNNVYSGIATVKVTFKIKYSGTLTKSFYIYPQKTTGLKYSSATSSNITLTWTKQPNVTGYRIYDAKSGSIVKVVKSNTNTATISGLNAGSVRKYKVQAYKTVNGSNCYGDYSNYYIVSTKPSATSIYSVSSKSKSVTIKWKKKTNATGYVIAYSTSSKFTSNTTKYITVSKNTTVSKKIKGLKKGKKYYFKVLTYKNYTNSSGKSTTVKSAYCKAKSIKCK